MVHYTAQVVLDYEESSRVSNNRRQSHAAVAFIRVDFALLLVFVGIGVVVVQETSASKTEVLASELEHRQVPVLLSVERVIRGKHGRYQLDERQEDDDQQELDGTYLQVELLLVQGLASDESLFDCVADHVKQSREDDAKRVPSEVLELVLVYHAESQHVDDAAYQDHERSKPVDLVLLHSVDAAAS